MSVLYDLEFYDEDGTLFCAMDFDDVSSATPKSYDEIHDMIIDLALTRQILDLAGLQCRSIWDGGKNVWMRVSSDGQTPHLIFL